MDGGKVGDALLSTRTITSPFLPPPSSPPRFLTVPTRANTGYGNVGRHFGMRLLSLPSVQQKVAHFICQSVEFRVRLGVALQ